MHKLLLTIQIFITILSTEPVQAQSDVKTLSALATQAKANGENSKAISYFEELYSKTSAEGYYLELIELYCLEGDYSSAEKIIKKRIKKYSNRPELIIDRGYIYQLQDREKEAEKYYNDAISKIEISPHVIKRAANKFIKYNAPEFAEKIYLKGRKTAGDKQLYRYELASVYAQEGKTTEMIDEYLDILSNNRAHLQSIQNILQRVLNPDPEGTQKQLLKDNLLGRIQKDSRNDVYSELLIWLYIQEKNFTGAFIQAKALDKRSGEKGQRLYSLAQLSLSNQNYETAEKCYQYIIDLGDESPYYLKSKTQLVEVLKERITGGNNYTAEDLQILKKAYISTLNDLGRSVFSLSLQRGLAELNAYYLDSVEQAIELLERAISLGGISSQDKAEVKIELADLMLLDGEIWEASLLYSQVEKAFKYDQLGETAKFKNAKIAYYTGDFYWAQAQLNVLKGSTSKLIANDALDLSLLITDNVGLDSITEPLEMFARADLLIFKKNFDDAKIILDSIPKFFPFTSLKDDILFSKYKIDYQLRNFDAAAQSLRTLLAEYAEDLLGDNALYNLAKLEEQLGNAEEAMELYKKLLTTYPSSLFVVESRKRYRTLRGDKLEEEIN